MHNSPNIFLFDCYQKHVTFDFGKAFDYDKTILPFHYCSQNCPLVEDSAPILTDLLNLDINDGTP